MSMDDGRPDPYPPGQGPVRPGRDGSSSVGAGGDGQGARAPAYLDVRVHHVDGLAVRFGRAATHPVALRINQFEVFLPAAGGRVTVPAGEPLHVKPLYPLLLNNSRPLVLHLAPGQVAPLYYSESIRRGAAPVVSPMLIFDEFIIETGGAAPVVSTVPFHETPGMATARAVGIVLAVMALVSLVPIALGIAFIWWTYNAM